MEEAHHKRSTNKRLFRLGLVLALVCLIPLTIASIYILIVIPSQQSQRDQRIATQLKALRADIRLDADNRVTSVSLAGCDVGPELQKEFAGLAHLKSLDLTGTQINDAGLAHLRESNRLEILRLDNTQITDAGLEYLNRLPKLEQLYLKETHTTDAGLAHLRGLTKLTFLDLSDTQITDTGLKHLSDMTNLAYLGLSGTPVTDEGLESLKNLIKLETLDLVATDVTKQGNASFETAMPMCHTLYVHSIHFSNRQMRLEPLKRQGNE